MLAATYMALTSLHTKPFQWFATLADKESCLLDFCLPRTRPRASWVPLDHVGLAPAEPTTLYGTRMELGLWNDLQKHCFCVMEFKHRHIRTAILLSVYFFVLNWNLNCKILRFSYETKLLSFSQLQVTWFHANLNVF